ncbi:MAG TPA: bifunctional adenosylcobinamide kinase/adenosylcobinamide-phosphate guanylyltransferase [Solirubrobacteraceae bacterium]|jgi:adenosylcobinamide kinase/adenosylcobinamide-phosphate guanylyltransferase|nr:bifunctional adenosylcobinamide kinase/adenosylcobinamide-phosphate guanylyltransferase [Solirubrobacteraceae bacterium]
MLTFVLGGIRSGKSAFARRAAAATGRPVTYLATGVASDPEMERRIEAHRRDRPATWTCVEEPVAIGSAVRRGTPVVMLESVDGWLSNRLWALASGGDVPAGAGERLLAACREELAELRAAPDHLIAVSSEVGLSLVPLHPAGRVFADVLGQLNQDLAAAADESYLIVAGVPVALHDRRGAAAGTA